MTISEYQNELEKIKLEHGELTVYRHSLRAFEVVPSPTVEHLAVLGKRERSVRLFSVCCDDSVQRGEKVVIV